METNIVKCANDDEFIKTKFRIGDIVQIIFPGETYSSYLKAWKILYPYFSSLNNYNFKDQTLHCGNIIKNGNNIWRIYDIGLHAKYNATILFLINTRLNVGVAIGENGCELLFHTRKFAHKPYYRLDDSALELINSKNVK